MTEGWSHYYDAAQGGAPRETLLLALDRFEREGRGAGAGAGRLAVDLGCGEGRPHPLALPLFVSLVYLLFRRALAVAALRVRSREFKELETLCLALG